MAITPLRARMIEDMNARKLGSSTQRGHIHSCKRFAGFLNRSPDTATAEDIRRFQLHLAEAGLSICNRNRIMTGLRFLFRVTLRRLDLAAEIYHLREPQRIPLVMSPDEARRLLAVASKLKVRTLLSLAYGCGLRASEVVRLKVKHIDSAQKVIRIEQSKGRKSLPSRKRGTATSCCRQRHSISCATSGKSAHRVTMPEPPCRNAGCFLATGAASR
jgi:site-specific recombinase XerD